MSWLPYAFAAIITVLSIWLFYDASKRFEKRNKALFQKLLRFGFLYIIVHVVYFFILNWLWQEVPWVEGNFKTKYKILSGLLIVIFPLLLQMKIFRKLHQIGYSYSIMRLSIEMALSIALLVLFARNGILNEEARATYSNFLFGILVYFAFSRVLIEWHILVERNS